MQNIFKIIKCFTKNIELQMLWAKDQNNLVNCTIDTDLETGMFTYISSQWWDQKLQNPVTMEALTPQIT